MGKYRLDNGEIIECDYIHLIHTIKIDKQDLKHRPQAFRKDFIRACTWGLSNGYSHILVIRYYIESKLYIKFLVTNEARYNIQYWIKQHEIHEDN